MSDRQAKRIKKLESMVAKQRRTIKKLEKQCGSSAPAPEQSEELTLWSQICLGLRESYATRSIDSAES